MAAFEPAVALVLRNEGGFVNNPNDPGGPTSMGITLAVLQTWRQTPLNAQDVASLTVKEASAIYEAKYWRAVCGDRIASQAVANHCLDMSVLRGTGAAAKSMQGALGLTQDGAVGPKTLAALNSNDPAQFLNLFRANCVASFVNIVRARPTSLEFLPGWIRRSEQMAETVNSLLQRTSPQVVAADARPVVLRG